MSIDTKLSRKDFIKNCAFKNLCITGSSKSGKSEMALYELWFRSYHLKEEVVAVIDFKDLEYYSDSLINSHLDSDVYLWAKENYSSANLFGQIDRVVFDGTVNTTEEDLLDELKDKGVKYSVYFTPTNFLDIDFVNSVNFDADYFLDHDKATVYDEKSYTSSLNCCPRCATLMVKATSSGFLSGSFNVMKCPKCHYCE